MDLCTEAIGLGSALPDSQCQCLRMETSMWQEAAICPITGVSTLAVLITCLLRAFSYR